jgi:GT2 family glycosyltransferase
VVGRILNKKEEDKNYKAMKHTGRISHLTANQIDHFDSTVKQEVDHGQGCNFSFRKSVLKSIGGFDTRFGGSAFLEDTDICLRVKQAGFKIIFEPEAKLIHLKSDLGGCRITKPQQWYYWYGHNYTLLFLKHFSKTFLLPFLVFRTANILKGAVTNNNPKVIIFGLKGMFEGYCAFKNDTRQKNGQI